MNCLYENCNIQPIFNYKNEKKAIYCKIHKLENMIDIKHKKCLEKDCIIRPNYNYDIEKKAIYCNIHKLENMIDIISRKCLYENCNTQPIFNYETEKKGVYCKVHKLNNMYNIKDKKCIFENCNTQPIFNYETEKTPIYCGVHKLENMYNIKDKKCIFENCIIRPNYNYKNEKKAIYCKIHKLENMIDIKHKNCTSCNLFRVEKRTKYFCSYCNPNKSVRFKTKELVIKSLLESNNIKFVHDKQITNDCCLKYRPDFLIDCNTYYIVLEVDEDAHSQYDKECEIIRMNNIITSVGLPTKFIRYNPDKKKISKKQKEELLIKTIKEEMCKEYLEDLQPIYLFY